MNTTAKNSKLRPRSISTSRPRLSTPIHMSRSRSQSTNISRYEPHEKIIQDLSTENDELKVLLKKYNDEKEVKNSMKGLNKMVTLVDFEELKKEKEVLQNYIDKDKEAFRKLNKELESCKKMISRHESIYLDLMSKYDKLNVNYKDNEKILDEYNVSFKMLRSQNKELERLNEFQKKANDETNKLFKKTMKSREIDTDELERYYKQYFSMEDEFYKKSYEELKKVHKKLLEFYNELKNECSKTYPHLKKMMNEHNVELKHT